MKICIECGRQLFDYDMTCDRCNSDNILSEERYKEIVTEIKSANVFKRKKLLQYHNYKRIYDRMQHPEKQYSASSMLSYNKAAQSIEDKEEYWKRINQHTINKTNQTSLKCPVCGSSNVSKIGAVGRVISTSYLGLASSMIGKTHKCNNCGTTW